uniref:Uncharacterized protein n=1 Tax=Arundo donax TaxID=35708 RepID=A0A0A9AUR7_ARUDO
MNLDPYSPSLKKECMLSLLCILVCNWDFNCRLNISTTFAKHE